MMAGWVRVETRFISHPKVLDIGPLGEALWLRGLCYAGEQLTDGFVPVSFLKRMGDMKALAIAERLVAAGLWETTQGGYLIHDYLDWQRSKNEATDLHSKRAEAGRRGGKQKASNMLANAKQPPSKNVADTDTDTDTDKNSANALENAAGNEPTEPPANAKKPLPENGEPQKIVAAYCRVAGIDEPANYRKAVGQAASLAKVGVTAEDVPSLFAAANWGDGADLGKMLGVVDRWRAGRKAPPPAKPYPPPLQKRIDNWTTERLNEGEPILPYPPALQAAIDDYLVTQNGARR